MKIFKSLKAKRTVYESYDKLLSLWGVPFRELDVDTSYGKTHLIITGSEKSPPLLLFHGVGDNSAVMWIFNIKELSRHFYCIAVDTLGGPGKSIPNEGVSKNSFELTDWINQVVNKLNLDTFSIAGVSNGATIAYNYALNETERTKKAICIEGGMVIDPIKTMFKMLLLIFPEILIPTRKNFIKIMSKMGLPPKSDFFEKHPEIADHMILLMKKFNQKAMTIHKLESYDSNKALRAKDKLYFIFGRYGMANEKKFMDIVQKDNFRYKIIEAAGHGVNMEQSEAVNTEIISYLLS